MQTLAPALFILLWSGAFIAVRAGLPDVSPLYFLTVRFAIATAVLLLIAVAVPAVRRTWRHVAHGWHHFVIAGVLLNGAYLSGAYLALTEITGATMALLGALHPLATALLSGRLLGDRFRPLQWAGFALGTAGVALVAGVNVTDLGNARGITIGLLCVSCLVAGTLYYARHAQTSGLVVANCLQLAGAAVFSGLLTLVFEDVYAVWSPMALGTLAYLTFGVSIGGMFLYLFMLKTGIAGKVTANFYLIPGVTALLGWAILGETLPVPAIVGFVVASLGIWLVQGRKSGTVTAESGRPG